MSPAELDEILLQSPMPTIRLTLASGDQIILRDGDRAFTAGLALVIPGEVNSSRFEGVSIPNIVLIEPIKPPPPGRRHRHRRNR